MDRINRLKYTHVESERRYLLNDLPEDFDSGGTFWRITDKYVHGTRLRLRKVEASTGEVVALKFTQKYKQPGLAEHETIITNFYLDDAEYTILETLPGDLLVKRRYRYTHAGHTYSVDVFENNLDGLVLCELESPAAGEAVLPDFAARDVTADPAFSGGALARRSREAFLAWFATQKDEPLS